MTWRTWDGVGLTWPGALGVALAWLGLDGLGSEESAGKPKIVGESDERYPDGLTINLGLVA